MYPRMLGLTKLTLPLPSQASRRLLDDELTARLAVQTRAFSSPHSSLSSDTDTDTDSTSNSTYERIFPLCADYQEPSRLIRKLPEFAQFTGRTKVPHNNLCAVGRPSEPPPMHPPTPGLSQTLSSGASDRAPHYAAADIISLQEPSDASIASVNLFAGADSSMREFPREKLSFKEKLGEGQFGEVLTQFPSTVLLFVLVVDLGRALG